MVPGQVTAGNHDMSVRALEHLERRALLVLLPLIGGRYRRG